MLGIPFLKTPTKPKKKLDASSGIDLSEIVRQASSAIRSENPSRALSLVMPWESDLSAPSEVRLIAGQALAALGRYPEAIGHFEVFLEDNPNSMEGLISAGMAAARASELGRALDWFSRASKNANGKILEILENISRGRKLDTVTIEELVAEVESHPGDRDRAIALALVLGQAGHFRAIERFWPVV